MLAVALPEAEAAPGDEVTLVGERMTRAYDTFVAVGGVRATVIAVEREECGPCDTCLESPGCTGCGICDDCVATCEPCVETVRFAVPVLPPGPAAVVVSNSWGGSRPVTLLVTGDGDTDTGTDTDTDTGTDTDTDTDVDTGPDTDGDP